MIGEFGQTTRPTLMKADQFKLQNPAKKAKKLFVQNTIADDSDDDLLIERFAQFLHQDAPHEIGSAARGEGDDEAQGTGGVILRQGLGGRQGGGQRGGGQGDAQPAKRVGGSG